MMSKVTTRKQKKIDYIGKSKYKKLTTLNSKFMTLEGNSKNAVATSLKIALKKHKGLKISLEAKVHFINKLKNVDLTKDYHIAPPKIVTSNADVTPAMNALNQELIRRIDVTQMEKSGWVFDKFVEVDYPYNKYEPFKGGSYILLPKHIADKKACINVKNEKDNECFKWAVLSALHPAKKDGQLLTKYKKFQNDHDFSMLTYPVAVDCRTFLKFQEANNLSLNVYAYEDEKGLSAKSKTPGQIYVLYRGYRKGLKHINLLYIHNYKVVRSLGIDEDLTNIEEVEEYLQKGHYVWIKNFNALMYRETKHHGKKHFCQSCFQNYHTAERLEKHMEDCDLTETKQVVDMPAPGSKMMFDNYNRMMKVPFVIYADFESTLIPFQGPECNPNRKLESSTDKYQEHIPNSYCMKMVGIDGVDRKPILYRGENVIENFINSLITCKDEAFSLLQKYKDEIILSEEEQEQYEKATKCAFCGKGFVCTEENGNCKVRDHCHVTGKFRGAAHRDCNIKASAPKKIPVIFHNLRGYDSHHIIKALDPKGDEVTAIPLTGEKYLSFSVGDYLFLDSASFLNASLETLVDNLRKSDVNSFVFSRAHFGDKAIKMMEKGVYPYDYVTDDSVFSKGLPTADKFYNRLNDEHVNEDDYKHAQEVYKLFKCKNFGDYHNLYLVSDVLLLADVFENFRNVCMRFYDLDPPHYFSLPGLAWDAALKMSKICLQLLDDYEMFMFVERAKRGGISVIVHRFAVANNKYVKVNVYDKESDSTFIKYLDANNLYGWAMIQALPYGDFVWADEEYVNNFAEILPTIAADAETGCFVECDLEYPEEIHDLHNDYPLAPERVLVTDDMLSPYCNRLKEKFDIGSDKIGKLVPNLKNKVKYVVHYRNLQLYLSLGMKLTKVHRVLQFSQNPWLQSYINFNTEQRAKSKNDFEKDFFKLMNNAVFGKTMEDVRHHLNIKFIATSSDKGHNLLRKYIAKTNFNRVQKFSDNLVAVDMEKAKVTLNKPIYVGAAILDLSKHLMYDFHYNVMLKEFPGSQLLFTDTDSLCYSIPTKDYYKDLVDKNLLHHFDTSDYPPGHPCHSLENKKVIGKFKDETETKEPIEFVGLRSKMYSLKIDNGVEKKTAKGVKRNVIKKVIKHSDFKKTLLDEEQMTHSMNCIRSQLHQLYSVKVTKTSLSCFDNKRYIHENGISSYAYGHYKI